MDSNYLIICSFSILEKIIKSVDISELEGWLDDQREDKLNSFAINLDFNFAVISVNNADSGLDFCGSGTYLIPKNSIEIINPF